MIAAVTFSALFLISYLIYHAGAGSVRLQKQGWIRPVYFVILFSHTILAALMIPLLLSTLHRALSGEFARHRHIARWTFPVWTYVSATGVVVYWILYW